MLLDHLGGLLALIRLGLGGAWNPRNRYWRWRRETAFGSFAVEPRSRRNAILAYGRWVFQMRRFR